MIFESFEALQVFWGRVPKKTSERPPKASDMRKTFGKLLGAQLILLHTPRNKKEIYIYISHSQTLSRVSFLQLFTDCIMQSELTEPLGTSLQPSDLTW